MNLTSTHSIGTPCQTELAAETRMAGFLSTEKIRRFATEAEAFEEGQKLVTLVRKKGTQAIYGDDSMSVAQALRMWSVEADGKSKSHADKITATVKNLSSYLHEPIARVEPLTMDRWEDRRRAGDVVPVCADVLSLVLSFATYHLGRCCNAGLTAFQMGHTSPKMVQRVYAVPAVRADWKAWWKIRSTECLLLGIVNSRLAPYCEYGQIVTL